MTGPHVIVSSARASVTLKPCFGDPILDVMNFLNEIVATYPDAISFAPGRPLESTFGVEGFAEAIGAYVSSVSAESGVDASALWQGLGQYSRTNGLIPALIARHLERDERIHVEPEAIIATVGAQEAMAIVLTGMFEPAEDILLVSDPTYIGITGLARVLGIRTVPVPTRDSGLDPAEVEQVIVQTARTGRVRALYDIPDFNNPLGTSLPVEKRLELIDVCRRHGVLLIEDNAYGMFAYDCPPLPTLKALDAGAQVLYIGSFSKTLFPGLRLGYLVADQRVEPTGEPLAQALSRVKSLITVNTPPLMQALAAGLLLEAGGSLQGIVAPKRERYRQQRDALVSALADQFDEVEGTVSWTKPAGGFFLAMTLPFPFGNDELRCCARDYGVIVCPMRFFSLDGGHANQIRLSFSYVDADGIVEGVRRLAAFVRDRMARDRLC